MNASIVVSNGSKILIWKQITTNGSLPGSAFGCFQWFKDTNLKANHNFLGYRFLFFGVVSNGSKILIWKQITTRSIMCKIEGGCFQWFKDTNLKANHNRCRHQKRWYVVVSNGSKILIWKQITTAQTYGTESDGCFQWFKDTNLKANHNLEVIELVIILVVSNGSKILIWKQITTRFPKSLREYCCFQWFKDTNLKANHNTMVVCALICALFPMVQRY